MRQRIPLGRVLGIQEYRIVADHIGKGRVDPIECEIVVELVTTAGGETPGRMTSSSSGPKSPQLDPSGRCFQRMSNHPLVLVGRHTMPCRNYAVILITIRVGRP